MNHNRSIYRRLNPKLLVQVEVALGLLYWINMSNISLKILLVVLDSSILRESWTWTIFSRNLDPVVSSVRRWNFIPIVVGALFLLTWVR